MSQEEIKSSEEAKETISVTPSFLEELVKSKKNESFKDPEVLAKSKLEADQHIALLEKQLKEMKEDLEGRLSQEKILEEIEKKTKEYAEKEVVTPTETRVDTTPDPNQLSSLIEEAIANREKQNSFQTNIQTVQKEMVNQFGENAKSVLETAAGSVGMEIDKLVELAGTSPDAFRAIVGTTRTSKETNTVPGSNMNTAGISGRSEVRNYAYYQKLRKENPSAYYNPKTQLQMHKDAAELGDRFN
jgi:hypothetical protein